MEITRLEPKKRQGLIVVITGNGKGKTTSAMGMALRSAGHGMKVCIIQFMKGDIYSGEWDGVKLLGGLVELTPTGKGFCGIQGNPYPYSEHRQNAQDALRLVDEKMKSGRYQVLILDCEYVALAQELAVPLVTADKQVLRAFPDHTCSLKDFASGKG
jgi:cob(I)alamin adenosyltransferase